MRNPLCCTCFRKYEKYKRYYNWLCLFLCNWLALALATENDNFIGIKIIVSVVLLSEFISFTRNRSPDPSKVLVSFWITCLYIRKLYEIAALRNLVPSMENTESCDKIISEYNKLDECFYPCNKLVTFLNYTSEVESNPNVGNIPAFLTKQVTNIVFDGYQTEIITKYSCDAVTTFVNEYNQGAVYHLIRYIIWSLFVEHLIKGGYYIVRSITGFFAHAIRFLPESNEH